MMINQINRRAGSEHLIPFRTLLRSNRENCLPQSYQSSFHDGIMLCNLSSVHCVFPFRAVIGPIWFCSNTLRWTRTPKCLMLTSSLSSIALHIRYTVTIKHGCKFCLIQTLIRFLQINEHRGRDSIKSRTSCFFLERLTQEYSPFLHGRTAYLQYNWKMSIVWYLKYVQPPTWCHIAIFARIS